MGGPCSRRFSSSSLAALRLKGARMEEDLEFEREQDDQAGDEGEELPEENAYADEYSEEGFWEKLGKFAAKIGKKMLEMVLVLFFCLKDPETPKRAKAIIIGALGYFISPIDAIPDLTPVVGFSDDLGALALALAAVAIHIKPEHREQAAKMVEELLGAAADPVAPD